MLNVNKLLLTNEKISFVTRKHVIIFLKPLIWTGITLLFLWLRTPFLPGASTLPLLHSIADVTYFAWIPGIIALLSWASQGLTYWTSIFLVTDRRVIMREGFFFLHATETNLSTISEIKIDQTLVGRILDFGSITINSFGGREIFDLIAAPYQFQKQVAEKRQNVAK